MASATRGPSPGQGAQRGALLRPDARRGKRVSVALGWERGRVGLGNWSRGAWRREGLAGGVNGSRRDVRLSGDTRLMARSLIVSYDLRGRDETSADYKELIDAIKSYESYAKLMLSTWIVVTDRSAEAVRDHLWSHMDPNDRLFVGPLGKPAAWNNLMASSDWMKQRP